MVSSPYVLFDAILARFPRELRDEIYTHLIASHRPLVVSEDGYCFDRDQCCWLHDNRVLPSQMVLEIREASVRQGHFALQNIVDLEEFLEMPTHELVSEDVGSDSCGTDDTITPDTVNAANEDGPLVREMIRRLDVTIDKSVLEEQAKEFQGCAPGGSECFHGI